MDGLPRLVALTVLAASLGLVVVAWRSTWDAPASEAAGIGRATAFGASGPIDERALCAPVVGRRVDDRWAAPRLLNDAATSCLVLAGPAPVVPEAPWPVALPISAAALLTVLAIANRLSRNANGPSRDQPQGKERPT